MQTKSYLWLVLAISFAACNSTQTTKTADSLSKSNEALDSLRANIASYCNTKQANIGVAVLGLENGDTLSINGNQFYSLMSVAKFSQALLLLHLVDGGKISMAEPLHFNATDLKQYTGSTLRKDHPGDALELSIPEALRYSIGQSDNITSNKIFEVEGGPEAVTAYVNRAGVQNIKIVTTYANMGLDSMHDNRATPIAIVQLLEQFFSHQLLSDSTHALLWKTMVESTSGPDRLKGQLPPGTIVAHKTGTSGTDEKTGVTHALNDVGIVTLPNGGHYAIAVFIADSRESAVANADIIASISRKVYDYFVTRQ